MYNEKMMEHFENPTHSGALKDADAVGKAGNPVCGDVMWIYLKIKDKKIIKAGFKTLGCAAAIASTDAVCELAEGKTIEEAEKLTKQDVIDDLGGDMPPQKVHCSLLGIEALRDALKDYKKGYS